MSRSSIELIPLFTGLMVTTNGTALSKTTLDLNVPRFRGLLPHAKALFLIGLTEGVTATDIVDWNVTCFPGFDRNHEKATSFDIASVNLTVPGPVRSADYTTKADFLLEGRLQLWWANHAGVNGAKTAILSGVLGVQLET